MSYSLFFSLLLTSLYGMAAEWNAPRGPNANETIFDANLIDAIPSGGLKQKWSLDPKLKLGVGFSSPIVSNGTLYISDWWPDDGIVPRVKSTNMPPPVGVSGMERVHAIDVNTGKLKWSYEHPVSYKIAYENGPRASIAESNGKLFFLGADGNFVSIDSHDGKKMWEHDFQKMGAALPEYGWAGHPLVFEDKVYVITGLPENKGIASFDLKSGKMLSANIDVYDSSQRNRQGYAPLTLYKAPDQKNYILALTGKALHLLDPKDLKEYWSVPFESTYGMVGTAPVVHDGVVYLFAMNNLSAAFQLNGTNPPTELWRNTRPGRIDTTTASAWVEGKDKEHAIMFGLNSVGGKFVAVNPHTQEVLWKTDALTKSNKGRAHTYGTVHLIKNLGNQKFYAVNEAGEFFILNGLHAEPGRAPVAEELKKFQAITPTFPVAGRKVAWAAPIISEGNLILRNDGELISYDLKNESYPKEQTKQTSSTPPTGEKTQEHLSLDLVADDIVKLTGEGVLALRLLLLDHALGLKKKQIQSKDSEKQKKYLAYQNNPSQLLVDTKEYFERYTKNDLWEMQNHEIAKNSGAPNTLQLATEAWAALDKLYDFPERFVSQSPKNEQNWKQKVASFSTSPIEAGDGYWERLAFKAAQKAASWVPGLSRERNENAARLGSIEKQIQEAAFYDFIEKQMQEIKDSYQKVKSSSKPYIGNKLPMGWGHWYDRRLEADEELWRYFAKMAMLEYSFYRATGIEVDRVKPDKADGAVELFDKKSPKTLDDYFSVIKKPELRARAIGLAKEMAEFSRSHTQYYSLYKEIKSLLPRFWTYHWEFHDLFFQTPSSAKEDAGGNH